MIQKVLYTVQSVGGLRDSQNFNQATIQFIYHTVQIQA